MKHQKQRYFGPKFIKQNVGNRRKPRKQCRFVSEPMKKILKQVDVRNANMQYALGTGRNRNGIGSKLVMVINKLCKSNHSENVHRGNHVVPQSKQHLLSSKVGQLNPNATKEVFSLVTISPKSRLAFSSKKPVKPTFVSSTSKMKQGFIPHANDAKMSGSQPKNLKAMPGLVLISKGRPNLNQGSATWMHKRDQLNGGNDITNANNTRRRKELLLEEIPKSQDDNCSEGENPTHRIMKKRRKYIEINEDEDDNVNQTSKVGVDSTRLTSRDGISKDSHDKIYVPFVVDCLKEHINCCSKPIDEPIWSGLLQIGNKDYIPLSGHLSTKSCDKVHNLSKSLTRVIEVTKLPRLKVWPKRWEGSSHIDDNIGLYFFPHKMRFDKYHDQLFKEVMENDLALRSIVDGVEMLMFPSTLLPKRYQTFQMKRYLWGVFKPRKVEAKESIALHQPDHTTGTTAFTANTPSTGIATDAAHLARGSTGAVIDSASMPNEGATNAPTEPDSSSIGATSGRMVAFVVKQTPRLEQLIREMQREGSLIMQAEMINTTGSWPTLATMKQCIQT